MTNRAALPTQRGSSLRWKCRPLNSGVRWCLFFCGLCLGVITTSDGSRVDACTVMRLRINGQLVIARNHDWPFGEAHVVTNLRGIEKTSLATVKPATWVSKYGSVSFCQFGREIPFAGMNEKGLTVDLLRLPEAAFPDPNELLNDPDLHAVNAIQWVQYQLDTAATVAEVVTSLSSIVPTPMLPMVERVHYFVTDPSGDVAIVEFIDGEAVVRHGDDYRDSEGEPKTAACVLANSSWKDSQATHIDDGSLLRYRRGKKLVEMADSAKKEVDPKEFAKRCLMNVAQGPMTQWNLIYFPAERQIHFRTQSATSVRWIDLDDLQFGNDSTPVGIDIDNNLEGDVREHLRPVSSEDNQRIVNHAFDHFVTPSLPQMMIKQLLLDYPSKFYPQPVAP
ncbi:linear amide C-N hydrolase [Rhodopirellula sp. JC740]|uniref:Linear amide C-N hydrolase n=1 Tax=Rhodopirellula halodulae TaxID=2894198 RepID=A0ABS8NF25_9BACT|nr:linear amide C-N hydrolase [Rhodopirellula sp. JC740]MCC9642128.1 linear amide C-N hydrolase [Rhodopirellula sp. JC740]